MGKNTGEKWSLKHCDNYVNRMCVGIDAKNKGLIMAEMDMNVGTEIQLMRRGFKMDEIESTTKNFINDIKSKNQKPLFAFYLNCAGRAAAYSQNRDEDVIYIQKAINQEFPLIGIYEGGEIAEISSELQVLDWTGVFCLFSEKNIDNE